MKRRQQSIIYQLAVSGGPVTALELAKRLGVSPRTIKSEMEEVRSELQGAGAVLVAKRNQGYSVQVTEQEVFDHYIEQLTFQSSITNNFGSDDDARFLYVARKLVSSSRYVKLEDIADELYMSRSTLREAVKHVMEFLESYHLVTESKPGLGIRTFGTEYHMRMAMTELFAVHFHKVLLDHAGMEYAKWIQCGYEERQDIRHVFLSALRDTAVKIADVDTQRLSIYFIIVRNRCRAGYRLRIPAEWKEDLKGSAEYHAARHIYDCLEKQFDGFQLPEEETVFLAAYLMCCRDLWNVGELSAEYPLFYDRAKALAAELARHMKDVCRLELPDAPWTERELLGITVTALAGVHFGLNGMKRFWYHYENQALESPVAVELGASLAEYLSSRLEKPLSTAVFVQFASLLYKKAALTQYDIRRQKLLLVNSDSISLNEIIKMRVQRRYGYLVESFTMVELYEIRGMNQAEYDGVLTDTTDVAYRYDLPHCAIHTLSNEKEMDALYNQLLIHAYRTDELIPPESQIEINREYHYTDETQFIQFLAFRHCGRPEDRPCFQDRVRRSGRRDMGPYPAKLAVVFGQISFTLEECMELYLLDTPGVWQGEEVEALLYVCVDWRGDWRRVKAMENILRQLYSDSSHVAAFAAQGRSALKDMVWKCLKYE